MTADDSTHSSPPSEFCDTLGASSFTTIPVTTLETLRVRGGGPPFLRVGKRRLVRYTYADLRAWMENQRDPDRQAVTPAIAQGSSSDRTD